MVEQDERAADGTRTVLLRGLDRAVIGAGRGDEGGALLQYAPVGGYAPLRRYLAGYLLRFGVEARAEEILIVNGAQQGFNLIARTLAAVPHVHGNSQRAVRRDRVGARCEIAVRERRIAQAVTERVERLAREEAVGTAAHRVILERRQVARAAVERDGQSAAGVVVAEEHVGDVQGAVGQDGAAVQGVAIPDRHRLDGHGGPRREAHDLDPARAVEDRGVGVLLIGVSGGRAIPPQIGRCRLIGVEGGLVWHRGCPKTPPKSGPEILGFSGFGEAFSPMSKI